MSIHSKSAQEKRNIVYQREDESSEASTKHLPSSVQIYKPIYLNHDHLAAQTKTILGKVAFAFHTQQLVLPWFGSVFFSVFHRPFHCRECSNRYDNTINNGKHCPTSYLADKKRFIQIHAANLEILKE